MEFNVGRFGVVLLLVSGAALAQPVYRSVDPTGKVTFSDQPPSRNAQPGTSSGGGGTSSANTGAQLPYELRQVVQRYPVTLYTGDECAPCGIGRSMLMSRGVPFDERTVKSNDDVEALKRLSGDNSLPLLTIGAQQLKGYSDTDWSQYLDAAGYPKSTQLPAGYRNPPAQPLVAKQPAAAPTRDAPEAGTGAPPLPPPAALNGPAPSNPAGIRF